jgi:hypothetical protein
MGKNKKGELGLGDFVARMTPYPLLTLKGKQIAQVAVGKQFTIAFAKHCHNPAMISQDSSKVKIEQANLYH